TWGIPLNNNFSKIDVLAGEVINGRGPESDINSRFNVIETEINDARGTTPSLSERLNVLLQADGNIVIENVPTSTQIQIGVTRLSVNPAVVGDPIAVGTNDTRMLTQVENDGLVNGGNTTLHRHLLAFGASDVSATYLEVNQALDGIGGTVTSANLTSLTNGSMVTDATHKHPNAGLATIGRVRLSVTPTNINDPIAVGTNDNRMLTQIQHDELTTTNPTALHKHLLVDGASDLVVTATILNQLAGSSTDVTASNLNNLTLGGVTGVGAIDVTQLHHHDNAYYRKAESDTFVSNLSAEIDSDIVTHDTSDMSHTGANFELGDVIATSLAMSEDGELLAIHKGTTDAFNTPKIVVRDGSGVSKAYIDSEGDITCNNIIINGDRTIIGNDLVNSSMTIGGWLLVEGDTTLGDGTDFLTVNCVTSTVNGDLVVTGGVSGATTYNGIDITALNVYTQNTNAEVLAARDGEANLITKINAMEADTAAVLAEIVAGRDLEVDLITKINSIDTLNATATAEIVAARDGEASLLAKVNTIDANIALVTNEVTAARGLELNLDTRLDAIELTDVNHMADNTNPHSVTITQAVAADAGTNITILELEGLTDGSDADTLHTHVKYDLEVANAKTSPIFGAHATISERLDAGDQATNTISTEVVDARTDIYATVHLSLDDRLDASETLVETFNNRADNPHIVTLTQAVTADIGTDITVAELETLTAGGSADTLHIHAGYAITTGEVETARGGAGTLSLRLDAMDTTGSVHAANTLNPHTVTITQAVAADAVSSLLVAELEAVTNGSNADALHAHAAYSLASHTHVGFATAAHTHALYESIATEVTDARSSTAYGSTDVSLDARLETSETEIINARISAAYVTTFGSVDARLELTETEIVNARVSNIYGASLTLDARLEESESEINTARGASLTLNDRLAINDLILTNSLNSSAYATIYGSLDDRLEASETEVINARGGQASLDTRLDAIDLTISNQGSDITLNNAKQTVFTAAFGSLTTWSVVHNLGTTDVMIQVFDGADAVIFQESANFTSITATDINTVTIIFPVAQIGRVVITG
ncbi:hypothetical protein N9242_07430, partial [Vicingaceae bacterium]|nr:hypothetical protein [Vicingaceae bacterium]